MLNFRAKRSASLLQSEISFLLQREIQDPRIIGMVSVMSVKMSKNLDRATVYVSIMGDEQISNRTFKGLVSSKSYIKKQISKNLNFRKVPEIYFKLDNSLSKNHLLYEKIQGLKNASFS